MSDALRSVLGRTLAWIRAHRPIAAAGGAVIVIAVAGTAVALHRAASPTIAPAAREEAAPTLCEVITDDPTAFTEAVALTRTAIREGGASISNDDATRAASTWSALRDASDGQVDSELANLAAAWRDISLADPMGAAPEADDVRQVEAFALQRCAPVAASASPRPSVSPSMAPVPFIDDDWIAQGPVYMRDPDPMGIGSRSESGTEFFVPAVGRIPVDAAALLPGEDVQLQRWTATGPVDAPVAAGVVEIRVPSDSLEAERFDTVLLTVELESTSAAVAARHPVHSSVCSGTVHWPQGSITGTAAVALRIEGMRDSIACNDPVRRLVALDATSGAELWRAENESATGGVAGTVIARQEVEGESSTSFSCWIHRGRDVDSGDVLWTYDERSIDPSRSRGCVSTPPGVVDGSDAGGRGIVTASVANTDIRLAFDAASGRAIPLPDSVDQVDPLSPYALRTPDRRDGRILVYSTDSGAIVYELAADRVGALGASARAVFDGRLYLSTSDQQLVVDVASGEIVSEMYAVLPVATAGETVYFEDGALVARDRAADHAISGGAATTG